MIFNLSQLNLQSLTDDDSHYYQDDNFIELPLPQIVDNRSKSKVDNWLSWRAAPYPADRHSEYLLLWPNDQGKRSPRILLSAVLDPNNLSTEEVSRMDGKKRYFITGRKAINQGYVGCRLSHPKLFANDIYEVIHSNHLRQGRPIAEMYRYRARDFQFPDYDLYEHPECRDICVGVMSPEGQLVAYLLGKRVGAHVQYDEIMGHADHLKNRIMQLLHYYFIEQCLREEVIPTCLNYGPWYSGKNPYSPDTGLNYWKRRMGFQPAYLVTVF